MGDIFATPKPISGLTRTSGTTTFPVKLLDGALPSAFPTSQTILSAVVLQDLGNGRYALQSHNGRLDVQVTTQLAVGSDVTLVVRPAERGPVVYLRPGRYAAPSGGPPAQPAAPDATATPSKLPGTHAGPLSTDPASINLSRPSVAPTDSPKRYPGVPASPAASEVGTHHTTPLTKEVSREQKGGLPVTATGNQAIHQALGATLQGHHHPPSASIRTTAPSPLQGIKLELSIREVSAPGTPAPTEPIAGRPVSSEAQSGNPFARMPAIVVGHTAAEQPVLRTPLGLVTLENRLALSVGSHLLVDLMPPSTDGAEELGSTRKTEWPTMQQALSATEEALPLNSSVSVSTSSPFPLPRPGPMLTNGLLLLLNALGRSDFNGWLGEEGMQRLRQSAAASLIPQLQQEFTQASQTLSANGLDWTTLPLPLFERGELLPAWLSYRREQRHDGEGNESSSTRFLVDLRLSSLGEVQLDGLATSASLALAVRTRSPLSDAMRQDITSIFDDALAVSGLEGDIGFQVSHDWQPMRGRVPLSDTRSMLI